MFVSVKAIKNLYDVALNQINLIVLKLLYFEVLTVDTKNGVFPFVC